METKTIRIKEKATDIDSKRVKIEIMHLKKSFGDILVFKDFNLTLFEGENLVVLGKSGAGKSVLIKCIVGLMEPDEGTLKVLGENIADLDEKNLNELRKKVGFLFQSAALYDSMTVRENLEFPLRNNKSLSDAEVDNLVHEALQNVGLEDAIDKMPSELSGGMRKRIGLARTLIQKPEIILYDEPTTGLDPVTSHEISELIMDIKKKYSTSSIIITHDIACTKFVADRIVLIRDGSTAGEGTPEEMLHSKDPYIKSFFNNSEISK